MPGRNIAAGIVEIAWIIVSCRGKKIVTEKVYGKKSLRFIVLYYTV